MYKLYEAKVLSVLKRSITNSERSIIQEKFSAGWCYKATAEYLK